MSTTERDDRMSSLDLLCYELVTILCSWHSTCRSTGPAYDNASTQLALALLRSDTLQAYAQLLAADLAALQAATRGSAATSPSPSCSGSSSTSAASPEMPSASSSAAAGEAACASSAVLNAPTRQEPDDADTGAPAKDAPSMVISLLHHTWESVTLLGFLCVSASRMERPGLDTELCHRLQEELLSAMEDSCILEHLCRLWLAIQKTGASTLCNCKDVSKCGSALFGLFSDMLPRLWLEESCLKARYDCLVASASLPPPLAPPQRAALRRVLSGPCLQLYLGWALAAPLSAVAGRPLYGLPPSLVPAGTSDPTNHAKEKSGDLFDAVWTGSVLWRQLLVGPAPSASTPSCPGEASPHQAAKGTAAVECWPQRHGNLPYKLRHVVALLMDAMRHAEPQPGEELLHRRALQSLVDCVAAAVPWVRASTAASWLAGLWPMLLRGLHGMRPDDLTPRAALAGQLLLAPLGERGSPVASSRNCTGASAQCAPSPSLRAALDAGLVPALERAVREEAQADAGAVESDCRACRLSTSLVDFVLRRPGVWPALLAHGPPAQVASLIVTMRKVTYSVWDGTECSLWRMQLVALLEQAAAALQGPGGEAATHGSSSTTAAGAGSSKGGGGRCVAALGWAVAERYCRQLTANRGISGLGSGMAAGSVPGWDLGQTGTDRLRDGPTWGHILHAGGCPPPGSPAADQQRRLAVFAASQWLPALLKRHRGGPHSQLGPLILGPYLPHRAFIVIYHWLMLAARECCAARGRANAGSCEAGGVPGCEASTDNITRATTDAASAAAHSSWISLLRAAGACSMAFLQSEALDVVPTLLDLGELVAAGAPGLLVDGLYEDMNERTDEAYVAERLVAMLQRFKRHGLLAALQQIVEMCADHGGRLPPGWRPLAPGLAAAAALSRPGSWRPLPPPCEVGAEALGLVGSCANPACTVLTGASEAEVGAAVAGGKQCGAVRYCCVECRQAHWQGGHGAECRA